MHLIYKLHERILTNFKTITKNINHKKKPTNITRNQIFHNLLYLHGISGEH